MPLFELVLHHAGRQEIRLTDRPLAVGDVLVIDYEPWDVVAETPAEDMRANARFMLEQARAQRRRASEMRERNSRLQARLRETLRHPIACLECDAFADELVGWRVVRIEDPDAANDGPELGWYCPRCARREFIEPNWR